MRSFQLRRTTLKCCKKQNVQSMCTFPYFISFCSSHWRLNFKCEQLNLRPLSSYSTLARIHMHTPIHIQDMCEIKMQEKYERKWNNTLWHRQYVLCTQAHVRCAQHNCFGIGIFCVVIWYICRVNKYVCWHRHCLRRRRRYVSKQ